MQTKFHSILVILFTWMACISASAQTDKTARMKVVALHPLMADLARQVGGNHVEVISLMTPNDDPHHFNPTPTALQQARGARLYLASGMGMETYLEKLRDTLAGSASIIEVGASIPVREVEVNHDHVHTEHCNHGTIDPHWWHRIANMQRAADQVAKTFAEADPAQADHYKKQAKAYRTELSKLNSWVRRELIKIPKQNRKLATAHESFGYFCDAYGFESLSVKGINKGADPSAKELANIVRTIKSQKIPALFPEQRANPKALKTLSQETGVRIGGTLIADGSDSYTAMIKHNVTTITKALK